MPRSERTGIAYAFHPFLASATVVVLYLRTRQTAIGNSAGSGVTIAGSEIVMRLPALVHAAVSLGDRALSLLFRIALAPPHFALATLAAELRIALGAIEHAVPIFHLATIYLLHGF